MFHDFSDVLLKKEEISFSIPRTIIKDLRAMHGVSISSETSLNVRNFCRMNWVYPENRKLLSSFNKNQTYDFDEYDCHLKNVNFSAFQTFFTYINQAIIEIFTRWYHIQTDVVHYDQEKAKLRTYLTLG